MKRLDTFGLIVFAIAAVLVLANGVVGVLRNLLRLRNEWVERL